MDDVAETAGRSHVHGVDVGLAEKRSGSGNDRRNVDFGSLLELTLVAGTDIPFDVAFQRRPPEAIDNIAPRGVYAFMAEVVMCRADNDISFVRCGYVKLMASASIASPESSFLSKKVLCPSKKLV